MAPVNVLHALQSLSREIRVAHDIFLEDGQTPISIARRLRDELSKIFAGAVEAWGLSQSELMRQAVKPTAARLQHDLREARSRLVCMYDILEFLADLTSDGTMVHNSVYEAVKGLLEISWSMQNLLDAMDNPLTPSEGTSRASDTAAPSAGETAVQTTGEHTPQSPARQTGVAADELRVRLEALGSTQHALVGLVPSMDGAPTEELRSLRTLASSVGRLHACFDFPNRGPEANDDDDDMKVLDEELSGIILKAKTAKEALESLRIAYGDV